jgi:hypothetical protein
MSPTSLKWFHKTIISPTSLKWCDKHSAIRKEPRCPSSALVPVGITPLSLSPYSLNLIPFPEHRSIATHSLALVRITITDKNRLRHEQFKMRRYLLLRLARECSPNAYLSIPSGSHTRYRLPLTTRVALHRGSASHTSFHCLTPKYDCCC